MFAQQQKPDMQSMLVFPGRLKPGVQILLSLSQGTVWYTDQQHLFHKGTMAPQSLKTKYHTLLVRKPRDKLLSMRYIKKHRIVNVCYIMCSIVWVILFTLYLLLAILYTNR